MLAVVGLSLYPHPERILGRANLYDKAGHFAAYLVLAFLAVRAAGRAGLLAALAAVIGCAALGGAIELLQPLVGRHRDLLDFLIDVGGSALGAAASALLIARARPGQRPAPTAR
jgi:VanZ family protein